MSRFAEGGFQLVQIRGLIHTLQGPDKVADLLRHHDLWQAQAVVMAMNQVALKLVIEGALFHQEIHM